MNTEKFFIKDPNQTFEIEYKTPQQHTTIRWWANETINIGEEVSTHYIYIKNGQMELDCYQGRFNIMAGFCGVFPGQIKISGNGNGMIATRHNYRGILTITGAIEQTGRLNYIDGCSATLLVSPLKLGDPCINFLYIPEGIDQTPHTHPSLRLGLVVSGQGICKVEEEEYKLQPSTLFCLPEDKLHSFHTQDKALRIVVYHPDSDVGPSDESHPMLNRTLVNGVPAHKIPGIRSRLQSSKH